MTSDERENLEKREISGSKVFQKLLTVCLLGGIVFLSGLIIFYISHPEPGFYEFGILNSERKAEDYPTSARVREKIEFYVHVENQLNRNFTFQLRILTGDENTQLSSNGSENARLRYKVGNITLIDGQKWLSPKLWVTFNTPGKNKLIIVELWEITDNNEIVFRDILWLRLTINPR
ncbi:MAG: DUF1616 domain-containing protein [Promethearchaeota archaeon]